MKYTTHLVVVTLLTLSTPYAMAITDAAKAGRIDIVKELLEKGVNPNGNIPSSYTPLHAAAERGDLAMCTLLLSYGAKVDYQEYDGNWGSTDTALALAAKKTHYKVVKLLLENGANVFAGTDWASTVLSSLGCSKQTEVIKILIELSKEGTVSSDKTFLTNFLNEIASCGSATRVAKQLLDLGAQVNGFNEGYTPLHRAAMSGNLEMSRLLLSYGATVDVRQKYAKKTALAVAAKNSEHGGGENKHYEVCKLLLENGADVNVPFDKQDLPICVHNKRIKKLLKSYGAKSGPNQLIQLSNYHGR